MKLLKNTKQNTNILTREGFIASNKHIAIFCFVLIIVFVFNTTPTFAAYIKDFNENNGASVAVPVVEFRFDEIIRTNANGKKFYYNIDKYSRGLSFSDIQPDDTFDCYFNLSNYNKKYINEVALMVTISCKIYFNIRTENGEILTYYYKAGSDYLIQDNGGSFSEVNDELNSNLNFSYAINQGNYNLLNFSEDALSYTEIESGNYMTITQNAEDGIIHKTAFLFKPDGNKKDMDYCLNLRLPDQSSASDEYQNRILYIEFLIDVEQIQI